MTQTSAALRGHDASVPPPEPQVRTRLLGRRQAPVLVAVGATVSLLYVLQASNERLLVSWHGFLHSAIANRFPAATLPPENPFFAGESLPYYWFYQGLAAGVGFVLQVDLIRAFQFLILASLAVLIAAGASLGRRVFQSAGLGLLAAYLALAGANPLGPVIAGAKAVVQGAPMLNGAAPATVIDGVFVTNELADRYLVHPVLPALYYSSDWRRGQNIVWFFDISSRAPAIALTLAALLGLLGPRAGARVIPLAATGGLLAAINPVMGLATAGTLTGAAGLAAAIHRVRAGGWSPHAGTLWWRSLALSGGALLAAPSYYHLFTAGQGGWELSTPATSLVKWVALTLTFAPIAGLAVWGALRAPARQRHGIAVTALAGLALLGAAFAIDLDTLRHVERGNEHNLTNAALCVLAVPAVAWISASRRLWHPAALVFLLFLPTTVLTVAAYVGSPSLPIAFDGRTLVRLPAGGPLDAFYGWARQSTPADAVFIIDPEAPVKMSGNVSELPAFTARTLFVDLPGYMTDGHPEAADRRALAKAMLAGAALTDEQTAFLGRLNRPMFLVTHHADASESLERLERRYGAPAFYQGFVAAFAVEPASRPLRASPPE